jgi:hypothetical protein
MYIYLLVAIQALLEHFAGFDVLSSSIAAVIFAGLITWKIKSVSVPKKAKLLPCAIPTIEEQNVIMAKWEAKNVYKYPERTHGEYTEKEMKYMPKSS